MWLRASTSSTTPSPPVAGGMPISSSLAMTSTLRAARPDPCVPAPPKSLYVGSESGIAEKSAGARRCRVSGPPLRVDVECRRHFQRRLAGQVGEHPERLAEVAARGAGLGLVVERQDVQRLRRGVVGREPEA